MHTSKNCSVVLQQKIAESTISTIDNDSDNESSTTEGICMNLLPFKVPTIRNMYVCREGSGKCWSMMVSCTPE